MGILTEELVYEVIRDAGPTFRNAEDKIAFAVHATLMASGFRLHATGSRASTEGIYISSSEEVGIEDWNQYDDYYAFIYTNPKQGPKKIFVKAFGFCRKLFVDAYREGDSQAGYLSISIKEYAPEKEGTYPYYLKNFGKLVGYIEKELVNMYGGSSATAPSDRIHHSRWPDGNDDVQPDLKHLRGIFWYVDDIYRWPDGNDDLHPDLKRPGVGSSGDAHPDLKRLRGVCGAYVYPNLKRLIGMIVTFFRCSPPHF